MISLARLHGARIAIAFFGVALTLEAAAQITANSLAELRSYGLTVNSSTVTLSSTGGDPHPVTGVVTPGEYWINGDHIANPTNSMPIFMDLGGTGNTYDLSGATINLDTRKLDGFGRNLGHDSGVDVIQITGSNNTVRGINLIGQDIALDTDPNAQRYADWATQYVELSGVNNTVDGAHVVTRGSRTDSYGLGDAFGKGASGGVQPFVSHRKASAFRVGEATNAVINDMHLEVNTFGHGFFVQTSTDTTLTNSTVTGELFSSQAVVDHPLYQQYGHTWWGNPIPDDIMISGAEGGVRVYGGASGLTVDNVVVTNMRTGFATVHDGGDVNISNAYAYGTQSGFDVGDNTTITNSGGDAVNGPLLVFYGNGGDNSIELELVGGDPVGVDWSPAFINGDADVTITSSVPAGDLPEDSVIRLGQNYDQNWRNFDYTTEGPETGSPPPYTNSTFTNNTNQILVLGENATGNTGSSQAPVITNGKDNAYDGISLVPAGKRTVLIHTSGLGNNGTAADGSLETNASVVESGATLEITPGLRIQDEKLTITGNGIDGKGALYSDGSNDSNTRFGSSNSNDESTIFLDGNASIGVGVAGNQLLVGSIQGNGNFTKRGPGKLTIGKASTFVGSFSIAEGEVVARPNVVNGNLTINPGASLAAIGDNAINTTGTVFLFGSMDINARTDDNSLSVRTGQIFGPGDILASNAAASEPSTLAIESESALASLTGQIQGNIRLIKSGAGTQALAGLNSYTGTTTVDGGVLLINGAHIGGDAYAVDSGGTLGGTGMIDADVTVASGGSLAPGASVGVLEAGVLEVGDVAFDSGSEFEVEVDASGSDRLIANSADLMGSLSISLLDDGSGLILPNSSASFEILSVAQSLNGVFDNAAENGARIDTAGGEGSFSIVYSSSLGSVFLTDFLSAQLAGDYNADGVVDAADYSVWRDSEGQTSVDPFTGADGDGDGQITNADYLVWSGNFGASSPTNLGASVPEPSGLILLLGFSACLPARGLACHAFSK